VRKNRQLRSRYSKAFGTIVDWEIDILYIGESTGHLRKTELLNTLALADGLDKLRNLAISQEVSMSTHHVHMGNEKEFKRCSPAGLVQQISGLKTLTVVGNCGLWKDGNELTQDVQPNRERVYNSESEVDDTASMYDIGSIYDRDSHRLRQSSESTSEDSDNEGGVRMRGGARDDDTSDLTIRRTLTTLSTSGSAQAETKTRCREGISLTIIGRL
jgi:hypothetical protein